jgi:hypothetical protein
VQIGFEQRVENLGMGEVGRRNHRRVQSRSRKHGSNVAIGRHARRMIAERRLRPRQRRGDGVGQRDDLDIRHEQKVAYMLLRHQPRSDHSKSHDALYVACNVDVTAPAARMTPSYNYSNDQPMKETTRR